MLFSKTFSYALRGILYLALVQEEKQRVQLEEIAEQVGAPKPFMGKVLKRLVKEGILNSNKGPHGGFYLRENTLNTPVLAVYAITDGLDGFKNCVLRFHECDRNNPCPMHSKVESIIQDFKEMIGVTSIGELLIEDKKQLLASIATVA